VNIIRREEWGAVYRDGVGTRQLPASRAFLHHSFTGSAGPGATLAQDAAYMRTLERIGQSRFGYGISYTYAVTEAGRVFEGHSVSRIGTHTGGYNTTGIGIVLIGDYSAKPANAAQIRAVVGLLAWLKASGFLRDVKLEGHRDVRATACPGQAAYDQLAAINSAPKGVPTVSLTQSMYAFFADTAARKDFLTKAARLAGVHGDGFTSRGNTYIAYVDTPAKADILMKAARANGILARSRPTPRIPTRQEIVQRAASGISTNAASDAALDNELRKVVDAL